MKFIKDYSDAAEWNRFVESHPESRFCHLYEYSAVAEVYRYLPHAYAFLKDGELAGVLPAAETGSVLFGRKLVSQPFSEYGGFLLDPTLTTEEVEWIIAQLRAELAARKIPMLELHGRQGFINLIPENLLVAANPHHFAYLDLGPSIEDLWEKRIAYSVRKAVNKAVRSGLTCSQMCDGDTIKRYFYPLYVDSMRRLGVPPHCIDYFSRCREVYGDKMKIFWALKDGEPIAGLLGFACGRRISIVNIVSDARYWDLRPNDLVHWEFIKWARAAGYSIFDFGSVRYQGQQQYKKKWGCDVGDHGHFFLMQRAGKLKVATFDSSSKSMKIFSRVWSKFIPRGIGVAIGPMLRKQLVR